MSATGSGRFEGAELSNNNRTVWSEGMFLGPHHFQQHDRFVLHTLAGVNAASSPYPFGLQALEIDEHALGEGRFSMMQCAGVFPDGTPFSLPADAPLPDPIDISTEDLGKVISLAIPFESHAEKDVAEVRNRESFSRYLLQDQQVTDRQTPDSNSEETVFTANLWTRLHLEGTDETAFHTIPLAKIQDRREDGSLVVETSYFPCALALGASSGLHRLCKEVDVLLAQRASDLATKVGKPDSGDSGQLTLFFMLQIINRAKPLMAHLLGTSGIHPEVLFRELVQIAGELATFCSPAKIAPELPAYNHRDQFSCFAPVISNIRESLNFTVDQKVAQFTVEHIKGGIFTCTIPERALFQNARFLLAVTARVPPESLRNQFSSQITISSKDKLRDLVTSHTTGVPITPVVQVPNNIPMYENFVYFELDRGTSMWSEIAVTGIIALHIAGNFPDLQMQLWTINQ